MLLHAKPNFTSQELIDLLTVILVIIDVAILSLDNVLSPETEVLCWIHPEKSKCDVKEVHLVKKHKQCVKELVLIDLFLSHMAIVIMWSFKVEVEARTDFHWIQLQVHHQLHADLILTATQDLLLNLSENTNHQQRKTSE